MARALLVLAALLAAGSSSPAPRPALPPVLPSSPAHGPTLREQAAVLGLALTPRALASRKAPADDVVLGAQKYPFGLANPLAPERSRARDVAPTLVPTPKPTASGGDDIYDETRLPTNVVPVRYTVTMAPQIGEGMYYGSTDIYLNVVEATKRIVLHGASSLTLSTVDLYRYSSEFDKYYGYGEATLVELSVYEDLERIVVDLTRELVPGEHYLLRFGIFSAYLRDDLKGFYLSTYKNANGETVRLATTQFEPPAARYAFPCFDEPALKARFKIVIEHDQNLAASSNMPIVRQTMPSLSTVRTEFDETLPMSTYLLAWVVSDFSGTLNGDGSFSTRGRPNAMTDESTYLSQTVGPAALEKLKDFTGIPYALPKVEQYAIPDFDAGAMENWGLVTYREEYLLESKETTIRIREFIATTVCHELGHQWTGNLVTLDWWSNTWLNEAFATYFENVICDQILPEWKLMDKYVTDNVHVGIANDVMPGQLAMSSPVHTPAQIAAKFDRISYKKGGAVLRMFENILGTAVWKKALNRYLSVNSFKNGSPDRLFKAMNAEAKLANSPLPDNVDFATMAKSWTEQSGVPVVSAIRNKQKRTVTLTQEQFFYDDKPDGQDEGEPRKWYIPVPQTVDPHSPTWSWDLASAAQTARWLTPDTPSVTRDLDAAESEWFLINPQQIGYYIVNYDADNWELLQHALLKNPDDFSASTRTQLVHDAMALARADLLSYEVALPFLVALKDEREAAPWRAAIEALSFLNEMLANTPASHALQELVKKITADAYKDVGLVVKETAGPAETSRDEERYLRFYLASYACNADNLMCAAHAIKALESHLDGKESLHADVKATAMCTGVRNSAELFGRVRDKWVSAGDEDDDEDEDNEATYAAALSCTKEHRLLSNLLDDVLDKRINKTPAAFQDLVNQIISRWDNHKFLFDYYEKNYSKISDFTLTNFWFNLLIALIGDVRTEAEYNQAEALVAKILPTESSEQRQEANMNLEVAKKAIVWQGKHFEKVSQWLYRATNTGPMVPTEEPPTTPPGPPGPAPTKPNRPTERPPPSTTPEIKASGTQVAASITLCLAAILFHLL